MAEGFGAAVNGVMFGSGNRFEVTRVVALKAGDESDAKTGGEERIFAGGFLAASQTRIAEDVDGGRPEGETVGASGTVVEDGVVVFAAGFGGDDVSDAVEEVDVPCGGEADGLREDSGRAGASDAVETFVPPVIGGNVEARDGGGDVRHLRDFCVEGETRDEIVNPLSEGESGG